TACWVRRDRVALSRCLRQTGQMHKTGMPVSVLRDRVGEVIFERGRRYATEGRVALQRHGPTSAEPVVTGSEDYVVEIEVASRDLAGSCTCPFAEDGFCCKHMVATVRRWAEAGREDEAPGGDAFQQENDGESAPESDEEERLRGFLAEQPLGWLVDEL